MNIEQLATELGNDAKRLRKRLNRAKALLCKEFAAQFNDASFDYANKRLVSNCGRYSLNWRLREFPSKQVGHLNQQTSVGDVYFEPIN